MDIDRRLLGWGVFFILVGAILLAVRGGFLQEERVSSWPWLWPVLLIGWGLGLVLRRTPMEWIGGGVTAAVLGLMAGGALRLTEVDDDTWVTAGFTETTPHLELRVSANAGSFDLTIGGACGA